MIPLLNIMSPSYHQIDKIFFPRQKNTYTRFNYNLFKLNENFREKSAKIGFKNMLSQKKTGNIYLDNMMIIESCSKEKNRKNNKRLTLSIKNNKEGSKNHNYQTEFNLALVPLREKITRYKYFTSLSSENSKSNKNYFDMKSRENLKKNLDINISNSNLNIPRQIANNYVKKVDDNYSDCHSVHAEQNAMLSASRKDMLGADMYLACEEFKLDKELSQKYGEDIYSWQEVKICEPCPICKRMIQNAGLIVKQR